MDVDQDPGSYRAKKNVTKVVLYKRHLSFFSMFSVLSTMLFKNKMHDTKIALSLSKFIAPVGSPHITKNLTGLLIVRFRDYSQK